MRRYALLCLSLAVLATSQNALADSAISIGSIAVGPGATFTLPVEITGGLDVYAYQFDISYDPAVLQMVANNGGSFLSSQGSTIFIPGTIDNTSGLASFIAETLVGPGPGASGAGTLATLDFSSLGPGSSTIGLSNVVLLDSTFADIPFTVQAGSVVVATPEPEFWLLLSCDLLGVAFLVLWTKNRIRPLFRGWC
jgi:hypothetical protein